MPQVIWSPLYRRGDHAHDYLCFFAVVVYRTYRLHTRRWELSRKESIEIDHKKKQADGLHPTLQVFDRRAPVIIISFLTTLCDTFDTIGVSEAAAVRVLSHFMRGDANDVLSEQFELIQVEFYGGSPES